MTVWQARLSMLRQGELQSLGLETEQMLLAKYIQPVWQSLRKVVAGLRVCYGKKGQAMAVLGQELLFLDTWHLDTGH